MRIVIRAEDARQARDAQAQLARAGFEAAAMAGPYRAAPDGEDIAVFLRGATPGLAEAAPLAMVSGQSQNIAPHLSSGFLAALAVDAPAALLKGQMEACIRLALAEEERRRRAETALGLGEAIPSLRALGAPKALYVGAPNATFLMIEHALAEEGGVMSAALSSQAGFDHLHDDVFDAVILNAAHDPRTALSLCATLRRNSMLHDLPAMALIKAGDVDTANAAIDKGACAILEMGARTEAPIGWLLEAVRRDRRRRHVEHELRALRDRMGDARTGLWRGEAFEAHLRRLVDDHHANGRPFSLIALRVLAAHGANMPPPEVWSRGFQEIASLAGRLSRETDCAAAFGADVIVVALPASALAAAKRTGERIASVAECTAFVSGDTGAAPLILEQSAVELQPGESGRGLMARALRMLDVEDMFA